MLASQSSLRNSILNQTSLKESSFLAQKLLSDFTTIHERNVNSLVVPKSLTNLFGHELIRKAGFDSLTEQVNFLLGQLFSLLVHFIPANAILPCNLFRKSFQYFRDHSTLMLIQAIAGKIASQRETVDLFLDTCRDIMAESDNCLRNSCLLLIVGAIAGYIL
ncbi:hypothetical protein Smp_140630 [Schistosoma mansoni]|uniref:hypothetical protein n=1 Tax=Schistosoma mansoni TaxID=6183 RepID=UPI00022DC333|nr:hypothetical protein Smp_140630 [Schistosoma mansoni]|eukprot:XP_018649791.1 hypothetical protein Smp_140630 [Schistosoma mansoni]